MHRTFANPFASDNPAVKEDKAVFLPLGRGRCGYAPVAHTPNQAMIEDGTRLTKYKVNSAPDHAMAEIDFGLWIVDIHGILPAEKSAMPENNRAVTGTNCNRLRPFSIRIGNGEVFNTYVPAENRHRRRMKSADFMAAFVSVPGAEVVGDDGSVSTGADQLDMGIIRWDRDQFVVCTCSYFDDNIFPAVAGC
jgi:hypothetical protein